MEIQRIVTLKALDSPLKTVHSLRRPKPKWIYNSKIAVEFKGSYLKQDIGTFTNRNALNLFIAYELDTWLRNLNTKFTQRVCLFGAVKLAKNADHDKYGYSGYDIEFDARSQFSLLIGECGKKIFWCG